MYKSFRSVHLLLALIAGMTFPAAGEGIPEPPVLVYGAIRNASIFNMRMTSGNLSWRVTKLTDGVPAGEFTINTGLSNLLGQFSYLVEIPCESSLPAALSTNQAAMILISPPNTYRFEPVVDGVAAGFANPLLATFSPTPENRGTLLLADLVVNLPCADGNGNQICDDWEDRYFGGFVDPNGDPDHDGAKNLDEFLAGTNPTNSASVFIIVDYYREPGVGFRVQWNSSEGRSYRLLSTDSLLNTTWSVVRSNIVATPPQNSLLDTNAVLATPYFYRLELEL